MKTEHCVRIRPNLKIFQGCPNLTPFISVFFILLIFFMIGSSFVPVQGIRVTLPQAASETTYVSRGLIVTVDRNARLYFNDAPADSWETLKRRIAETISGQEGTSELLIRCDDSVKMKAAVKLMEIAESLNLNAVFMTDPPAQTQKTSFNETE